MYCALPIDHVNFMPAAAEEVAMEEVQPIKVDELLLALQDDPESVTCYKDTDLLIQGYISTIDENNQGVFIVSGMEDNYYYSNFFIYITDEQRNWLQYYYTYGNTVTAYVHCNDIDDYYGFMCDLKWFY